MKGIEKYEKLLVQLHGLPSMLYFFHGSHHTRSVLVRDLVESHDKYDHSNTLKFTFMFTEV